MILAFASVYLAWGSTYLAIRIGVEHVPPTVLAGTRFAIAGAGMLLVLAMTGRLAPTSARELRAIAVMAFTMLIGGNGLVVWAEQTVPSGMAALIVATVPIWMAGLAALPPGRERLPRAAVAGVVLGFLGVAVLARPSGGGDLTGLLALVLGWWFLDEPITPAILAGSAIVVVAVALVTAARVPVPTRKRPVVDPLDAPA